MTREETASMAPPPRGRPRTAALLALAAALLPALPWLLVLPRFGPVPSNDYYSVLSQMGGKEGAWERSPAAWLRMRSNEHRVTIPALIYAANIALFDGDNRGHAAWSLLMLAAVAVLLHRFLAPGLGGRPAAWGCASLLAGLLVFNPVQTHNVAMGFSGVMWLTSNLFAVLAIAGLARHAADGRWRWLIGGLAAGLLGLVTYSSNLGLWPALLIGALALRVRPAALAAVTVTAAGALGFYRLGYRPIAHHQVEVPGHPGFGTFVGRYFGNLFADGGGSGLAFGIVLLAASAVLWGFVVLRRRHLVPRLAPFLMVQVYAVANACGTAVGRAGMGIDTALSSRYGNLVALGWLGLLLALWVWVAAEAPQRRERPAAVLAGLLAVVMLGAAAWERGEEVFTSFLDRGQRQNEAIVALQLGLRAPGLFEMSVSPKPEQVWNNEPFLRAIGHVPFDRPLPFTVGEAIDPARVRTAAESPVRGEMTVARMVAPGVAMAGGWADSTAAPVEWIVLVDQDWVVRGGGAVGFGRRPTPGGPVLRDGWRGHLRGGPWLQRAKAYAMVEGSDLLYGLPGRRRVERPPGWRAGQSPR